jgi:hypothetical protein
VRAHEAIEAPVEVARQQLGEGYLLHAL